MQIFIGLSEIVLGIIFIVLIWRCDLVERYFRIGEIQKSFMRARSKRIDRWLERRGETQGERYLREHPRLLQWIWTIASFAGIALGVGAVFNLREYMLLEIIIPIGMFLTILLFLSVGIPRE
jgi:hypothetical protein